MKQQDPITRVAIAMGSNLGHKRDFLIAARLKLMDLGSCFRFSRLFVTEAVDSPGNLPFLNAAASFETSIPAHQLLVELHHIEETLGRVRGVPNAPRTLDLDLLLYGSQHINDRFIELPHPRLHQRLFVLIPLSEVWDTGFQPPGLVKTLACYLELCKNNAVESLPLPLFDPIWSTMTSELDN